MYYYKILTEAPKIGTIVDTNKFINYYRIDRQSKLNTLFNLLFELSFENELSIQNIFSLVYPNFKQYSIFESNQNILDKIEIIKLEINKINFNVNREFLFFNDFVLDKVKTELNNDFNLDLPDRFKSHYFFETLSDCYFYYLELGCNQNKNSKIIEIELIETIKLEKMDNRLIVDFQDYFTSKHFYNQAKDFLTKKKSENPLFEIIFQGKYKVNRLIPIINI